MNITDKEMFALVESYYKEKESVKQLQSDKSNIVNPRAGSDIQIISTDQAREIQKYKDAVSEIDKKIQKGNRLISELKPKIEAQISQKNVFIRIDSDTDYHYEVGSFGERHRLYGELNFETIIKKMSN